MNLPTNGLARYSAVKVTTSSPGELLVLMFDSALRFVREATVAMAAGDRGKTGERIGRALAILEHLLGTLNPKVLPDLGARLAPLYEFCMRRLTEAGIQRDPSKLAEVTRVLTPLRDGYRFAVEKMSAERGAPDATSNRIQSA